MIKKKKYAFVYYIQPLIPSLKCVPIYFQPDNNWKAKDTIINTALEIATILNENNFNVITIVAYGDNTYDKKAREIFNIYREALQEGGLDVLKKALEKLDKFDGIWWITDLLHVIIIIQLDIY